MTAHGADLETHPGTVSHPAPPRGPLDRALHWTIAVLVVAQAVVVGLQVIARHVMRQPIPWTEEVARLLLVWLMCVGGISALAHGQHPRVTALVRLFAESRRRAIEQGLRVVLLAFFVCLIVPAWNLTVTSAAEQLPASGLSGAVISAVLPASLLLMCGVLVPISCTVKAGRNGGIVRCWHGRSAPRHSRSRRCSCRCCSMRRRWSCW